MPRFDIQFAIHIHERRHQMGMIREIKSTQRSRILIRKSSNIKTAHTGEGGTAWTHASQSEVEAANGLNLATAPFETQSLVFSKPGRSSERCRFFFFAGLVIYSARVLYEHSPFAVILPNPQCWGDVSGKPFSLLLFIKNFTKAAMAAASKVRVIYCTATPRRRPLMYHMAGTAPGYQQTKMHEM